MPILDANGRPAGKAAQPDRNRRYGMGGTKLGYVIARRDAKGGLTPLGDEKGNLVLIWDPQMAVTLANQSADAELRPRPDQKVVVPLQESSVYLVVECHVIAQTQAKLKNPEQLLAPGGKTNG
jgi:hypothetical protein